VKPAPFAYTKAKTLKEAVTLLAKHKDDARLLAGGQSLIATLNMRLSAPDLLIDINGIKNLNGIAKKGKYVEIGALARHAQVEHSDVIAKHAPLITLAMPHIGHPAIRNRGTFGGSIAFADPAAELPACLLALGGEIQVPTLDEPDTVKVPDGTQTGTTFRLRGKGMPDVNGRGRGDLVTRILVETPTKLSKEQREILEQFRETETGDECPASKGFFSRIRDILGG